MKKMISFLVLTSFVSLTVSNVYRSVSVKESMSDFILKNIEALSNNETSDYDKKIWERYYREDGTGYNCTKTGGETC